MNHLDRMRLRLEKFRNSPRRVRAAQTALAKVPSYEKPLPPPKPITLDQAQQHPFMVEFERRKAESIAPTPAPVIVPPQRGELVALIRNGCTEHEIVSYFSEVLDEAAVKNLLHAEGLALPK